MMEVQSSIVIEAPASAVWSVLTDLGHYRAWNPFIRSARGSTDAGGTVRVRVRSSFGLPLAFRAKVLGSEPDRELHWRGEVVAGWIACGEHWFTIEPICWAGDTVASGHATLALHRTCSSAVWTRSVTPV